MKVATLESQNVVSRRDVNTALNALNIPRSSRNTITDGEIIDHFQSLLADQAPSAQQRSREHLYKLGAFRNSTFLINASRQTVETYEDALAWLGNGVTKDTPDESLLAVYDMKVSCCIVTSLTRDVTLADFITRSTVTRPTRRLASAPSPSSPKSGSQTFSTRGCSLVARMQTR